MMHWLSSVLHLVMLAIIAPLQPPAGYGVWGGGNGPRGLSNSPGTGGAQTNANPTIGNTGPLPPYLPAKSINRSYRVIIAATGVPQPLPNVTVQSGAQVAVRAHNGTTAGNTNPLYSALYREGLLPLGAGDPITPDTEIAYPVDNLQQIWICGTIGDGVVVSIRATGFGG